MLFVMGVGLDYRIYRFYYTLILESVSDLVRSKKGMCVYWLYSASCMFLCFIFMAYWLEVVSVHYMLFSWFWKFTQWSLDFDLPELLAESYKVSFCSWFFINCSANCLLFKTIYLNHIKITWQIHWNLIICDFLIKNVMVYKYWL